MRAVLCGANGAMGKLIGQILGEEIVGRVSIDGENGVPKTFAELGHVDADVVIDFSHHSAIGEVLSYAEKIGCAAVIGTTGHTPEEKQLIYPFRPVTGETTRMYHISDAHNRIEEPVAAAKTFGQIDLLILNGDILQHSGDPAKFINV